MPEYPQSCDRPVCRMSVPASCRRDHGRLGVETADHGKSGPSGPWAFGAASG
ncbi:siderophore-interacting protein [Yoonia sp.]|uniref:siderophore-interacting protein n=1 Tax=Yoonia sp. TaxID=2212373 RepID=UPI0035577B35